MIAQSARARRRTRRITAVLVVLGSLAGDAAGEPADDVRAEEPEERADLERRIEELEARERERDAESLLRIPWPPLTLGGFANVDYRYTDEHVRGARSGDSNHFALGELDLFLVSQLSDRFSVLGELLFEFDSERDTRIDVERLLIKYEYRDWLSVSAGRGHTPVGYWNRTYHHGTFLWTTVERPLVFEFEDEGGILPMHFVGLEASGTIETQPGLLGYTVVLGNGRGRTPEAIQLTDDLNAFKMVALELIWRPTELPDFSLGGNFLYDKIPSDPSVMGRERNMDEYIAGANLIYAGRPIEVFVEGQYIRHQGGSGYDSYGGYAQVTYQIRDTGWTPYYRFDLLEIDENDPFFAPVEGARDTLMHTAGVRFDWTSFLALKVEYQREDSTGRHANIAAAQVAVRF